MQQQLVGVTSDLISWCGVAYHIAWGRVSLKDVVGLFFSVVFTQRASLQDLSSTSSTLTALRSCETVGHWMLWSFKQLNRIVLFILYPSKTDRVGVMAWFSHLLKRHQTKLQCVNRNPSSISTWHIRCLSREIPFLDQTSLFYATLISKVPWSQGINNNET